MVRYQMHYHDGQASSPDEQMVDVPDIPTALVVADILEAQGTVELREGKNLIARISKVANNDAPFWKVN